MSRADTYFQRARQRAQRRKSPWNLILIPLAIGGIGTAWFLLARGLLNLQHIFIPDSAILSGYIRVGSILMFVFPVFPSIGIGMIMANLIAWCIPPARKVFEKEAKGIKSTSFTKANRHLIIFSLILFAAVAPMCLLGAMNYFYVAEDGIHLNPIFSLDERHYPWGDIQEIHMRCLAERKNLHLNYKLRMKDGSKVDLMEEPRLRFASVYDRIKPFIEEQDGIVYRHEITDLGLRRLRLRYNPQDAEKILSVLRTGT